ncbi:hypothetical protein PVAP13_9KG390100 [Panicum virgatum]|uniref:PLATZ transcription factor family protein n=1 Tax=Panicum virgatum TaxID=38727 RepID=A0A8T0NTV5_PANVG|nr:hypothetical protein PVAP13_9KG390100 [Panicum virgatum]
MSGSGSSSTPSKKEKQILDEEEEEKPEWLDVLLSTNFWGPCREHAAENRAEKCMFCLHCYNLYCPHCTHDMPGHRLLKIRRYVYRSVVLAKDMMDLKINVSRIQTYIINGQRVVHLRPMNRSKLFRPQPGTPRCLTCDCWLRTWPNLFCSLTCEGELDVSQDDFSGPEAERRYRSLQTNMLAGESAYEEPPSEEPPEPEADQEQQQVEHHAAPEAAEQRDEEPPAAAAQDHSFRRRGRKQAEPTRAPFF